LRGFAQQNESASALAVGAVCDRAYFVDSRKSAVIDRAYNSLRRFVSTLVLCAIWSLSLFAQVKTRAERTNYIETSRYDDVVTFLNTVAKGSPVLHNTTFGYTFEGRPLPLSVVGRIPNSTPRAVRASGKLRVYIQANIHAGEVEGKEALQAL